MLCLVSVLGTTDSGSLFIVYFELLKSGHTLLSVLEYKLVPHAASLQARTLDISSIPFSPQTEYGSRGFCPSHVSDAWLEEGPGKKVESVTDFPTELVQLASHCVGCRIISNNLWISHRDIQFVNVKLIYPWGKED